MINFKNREDVLPSVLILLSLLILAGALAFMLLAPKPSAAGVAKGRALSRHKIQEEIAEAKQRARQLEAATRPRLWKGDAEAVTAAVLKQLTGQAVQRKLKLAAFRPQKSALLDGMVEIPFSVQVSGPYPAVRAMAATLDAANSKLALRSIQVASMDAESSAVTATLNLSAYLPSKQAEPAQPARRNARG